MRLTHPFHKFCETHRRCMAVPLGRPQRLAKRSNVCASVPTTNSSEAEADGASAGPLGCNSPLLTNSHQPKQQSSVGQTTALQCAG